MKVVPQFIILSEHEIVGYNATGQLFGPMNRRPKCGNTYHGHPTGALLGFIT